MVVFSKLREIVLRRAKGNSAESQEKGDERERLVQKVLEELKQEKKIFGFEKTTKFGTGDLEGVDFYLIVIRNEYVVIPIQVTGVFYLGDHKSNHPDIPVVCVPDGAEREEFVRYRLELIINSW